VARHAPQHPGKMDAMARTVIARQFGDIQDLEVVDLPIAEPEAGQVRIAVRAAAINPADLKRLRGMFGRNEKSLPLRLGSELSGVVTAVGPDAVGPAGPIAVGDEVVGYPVSGGFAEELLAKTNSVLPKPANLGWGEAAGLLVGAVTAFHLVEAVGLAEGDRVIVHGATGNVGLAAVQLARLRGAEVIGTVSASHEDELRAFGAVPVLYGPGLEERLRAMLPNGADAALDTVGTDEALDASVALVRDRQRIATIAGFARASELGIRLLGSGQQADPGTELRAGARLPMLRLAGDGLLVGPPVVSFPLERVQDAMTLVASGHAGGKVVLEP
jgi:NADPH2:quinone reductase